MNNMGGMMKQAQKLQKKMLKVIANGSQKIESIKLEQEIVDPEDIEMLQDLILAATNDALNKSQEMVSSEMGKLTGGMNIPGLT